MSGHTHQRLVCPHGQLISQCRCPEARMDRVVRPSRMDRVVRPCPFPAHDTTDQELYQEAAERYARDPEFHARAVRVEQLIEAAEPALVEEARFGLRWGAAVALHLVDVGIESAHPVPGQEGAL